MGQYVHRNWDLSYNSDHPLPENFKTNKVASYL